MEISLDTETELYQKLYHVAVVALYNSLIKTFAGNSGSSVTWVSLQQPEEQRYPVLLDLVPVCTSYYGFHATGPDYSYVQQPHEQRYPVLSVMFVFT